MSLKNDYVGSIFSRSRLLCRYSEVAMDDSCCSGAAIDGNNHVVWEKEELVCSSQQHSIVT